MLSVDTVSVHHYDHLMIVYLSLFTFPYNCSLSVFLECVAYLKFKNAFVLTHGIKLVTGKKKKKEKKMHECLALTQSAKREEFIFSQSFLI